MIGDVFIGYCRLCGLEYACIGDWLEHRHECALPTVEDYRRATALLPREPRQDAA